MMRCHYTSIVMDKIKNNDNKKFWQECRDWISDTLHMEI